MVMASSKPFIMRRRLPSTAALLAFEAAARRLSFTQAGQDLHLTQSAISHQVQVLEDSLGNRLFERSRQGIKLTRAGQRLLDQLGPALDALEGALGAARTGARSAALPTLQVAVAPTFASRWLIPRLP